MPSLLLTSSSCLRVAGSSGNESPRRCSGPLLLPILAGLAAGPGAFLRAPGVSHQRSQAVQHRSEKHVETLQPMKRAGADSRLAKALGLGLCLGLASGSQARMSRAPRRVLPQVDWTGTATGWEDIRDKSILDVDWKNIHGVLTAISSLLFVFQIARILAHLPPSEAEVWLTTAIYLPWTYFCFRDAAQLENHYRVTFNASCGWAIMSLSSLHSVVWQDKYPQLALGILGFGNVVFAAACLYFYFYHWSRMWRHFQQNRFRPLWIPGLLGLMLLHSLTPLDFVKRIDDGGWWSTVCSVYSDEWWWVADVRIIELFVTAAALLLIILHIQGVFTGMKNAAVVVIGTIFAPLGLMALESTWLKASAWQHYLMVGPKYW